MSKRPRKQPTLSPPQGVPGAIIPDAVYRLDEVKARMGWRDAAFRAAVRAGLRIYRSGKRIYLLGSDIVAFVTRTKEIDR
jgi:hypothetical protein